MKRLTALLISLSPVFIFVQAQCFETEAPVIHFTGQAPAPWSINGQANDWNSIFGNYTGNPATPYSSSNPNNFAVEYVTSADFDHPAPNADVRFIGYTYDSRNVYFYLRRLENGSQPISFYYFIDVNLDGFMNTGEPVIGGTWAGAVPIELSSYVPNINVDYVSGKGNMMASAPDFIADGYSMKGTLNPLFSSNNIPAANSLLPGEVFKSQATENGYGLEFSIPWRYLKNWASASSSLIAGNAFRYHVSTVIAPPKAPYSSVRVADNVGTCCKTLAYVEVPKISLVSVTRQVLSGGVQRFHAELANPMNGAEGAGIHSVSFSNLQINNAIPFNISDIHVSVMGLEYEYEPLTSSFERPMGPQITIPAGGTNTIDIDVIIPAGALLGYRITILPSKPTLGFIPCFTGLGGGPGNPPIIYDVVTDANRMIFSNPEEVVNSDFKVYPNPGNTNITVSVPVNSAKATVRVEDMSGRVVQEYRNITNTNVKLSPMKPGLYIVRYIEPNGHSQTRKLVVQ